MKTLLFVVPVCVGLLGGCGGPAAQPAPSSSPAAVEANPGAECGPVRATGGTTAKVVIREGAVACEQATDLLARYFGQLTPADLAAPEGAGPIPLDEWTCGSGPSTDPGTTCSTEDGRQIDALPS